MTLRPVAGATAVAALAAALVGLPAPPTAGGELPAPAALPPCPVAVPASARSPAAPVGLPAADPAACRARPTRVEPVDAAGIPVPRPDPRPGYHHLGATTVHGYSGVLGRLTVRDAGVRAGSFDFVATRFMARHALGEGRVAWLEVGWAETGWSGDGAQRIYAFDSATRAWVFFEEYRLTPGDRVWIYLHSDVGAPPGAETGGTADAGPGSAGTGTAGPGTADGPARWRAWLWWGGRWRLLAAPELPLPAQARLEQYVEVHLDGAAAGRAAEPIEVPPVRVDAVQVRGAPDGPLGPWRAGAVPTVTPPTGGGYCLAWRTEYDSWSAGDCAATVQG